jgi:DNA gyrase subunit A
MNELGLTSSAKYRKSAAVVGEVLAKYHPHGDVAVYDSLVRMAQDFAMRYPLVKGQGNFGSLDGDEPAAMRYTEAKMAKISSEMLSDIDKETVSWTDNYDATRLEPNVLPAKIPNLLINGAVGIAVGMATNIPPHNLVEVCDAIIYLIKNPDCTIDDLTEFVKGPDFPTGATIFDTDEIKNAYVQGKGKVVMRANAEIIENKKGFFKIIISEIPFQVNKATLVTQMADLVKNKKVSGISDIRDESDKDGIRVVIELKRDSYPKKILNQLYQYTQMQESFHMNMLALVDGIKPQVLNLKDILSEYIKHRQSVIYKRTQFELTRAKNRSHILEGLLLALANIDEVIRTIKKADSRDDASKKLQTKFKLSELQANAVLDMKLSTLAHLEREKIEKEYAELQKLIKALTLILENPKMILDIITDELEELKKNYPSPRRTKIIHKKIEQFGKEDLIPNKKVIVTLTEANYIKRLPIGTYKTQHRGGKGVMGMMTKETDLVDHLLVVNNHDNLLFFTNSGKVFNLKAYDIQMGSRRWKGQAIVNLMQIDPSDKITGVINIGNINNGKYLIMATEKGQIKKTAINAYSKIRKSGLIAIRLKNNDLLKWVTVTTGEDQIIIVTKNGQAIKFLERNVRPMGRGASGVRGIKLRPNDLVVGMGVVSQKKMIENVSEDIPDEVRANARKSFASDLIIITGLGYGKKTPLKNYPIQSRGGIGLRTARVNDKTGPVIEMKIVDNEKSDIIMISQKGQVIRTAVKNVKRLGRATSGVRLMRLNKNDSVASVTLLDKAEPTDEEKSAKEKSDKAKSEKSKIQKPKKIESKKKKIISKKSVKKIVKKNIRKPEKIKVKKKPIFVVRKKIEEPKPVFKKKNIAPQEKNIPKPSARSSSEPNYWGKDNTLWKKKKI